MLLKEAIINKQEITYSKENRKMDNTMLYRSFMQALKGDLANVDDSVKPLFEANGNRGFTADLFMTRADSYTTTSNGGTNTIYEQNIGFLDLLRARTAVLAAGGSTRTGVGSLSYIRQKQSVTAVLRGENSGPVTASNADFEKVPYTPKALVAKVFLTDELQKESILDLQSILKSDMIKQFALAIDNYSINGNTSPVINGLLSAGSGIYNGDLGTAALPTWGAVNHLKGLVDQLGVDLNSCAYITTPALMSVLETTPRFANGFGGPIADANKVGSYPIFTSSHVPVSTVDHTLIFGDFSNLEVCLMGPTEFSIDTMTRFDEGVTILTARQYFDIGIKQKLAFAKTSNFLIQ
jgi:HK97 family phage major capsid protein